VLFNAANSPARLGSDSGTIRFLARRQLKSQVNFLKWRAERNGIYKAFRKSLPRIRVNLDIVRPFLMRLRSLYHDNLSLDQSQSRSG
jgi:hypothetical protein